MSKIATKAFAAYDATPKFAPFSFEQSVGPKDVHVKVKFCGICHSDVHQVLGEWHNATFPMVPGHEIAGIVSDVGSKVTKFKKGDKVGVGCMVDSCRKCKGCSNYEEQYCSGGGPVMTYNSKRTFTDNSPTYGGYSSDIVVDEDFVVKIPDNLDLAASAPLLCAGITMYSPMKKWKMDTPGTKIAVLGLGGLGHMAVKFGVAFGCEVKVLSHSKKSKEKLAKDMGAKETIDLNNEDDLKAHEEYFDFIIDTTSMGGQFEKYLKLLACDGALVKVGAAPTPVEYNSMTLIRRRRQVAGSLIGGIKETQEMMNFCGQKNIVCDIEKINMNYVPEAYKRVVASDVKFRFVIDCESL